MEPLMSFYDEGGLCLWIEIYELPVVHLQIRVLMENIISGEIIFDFQLLVILQET